MGKKKKNKKTFPRSNTVTSKKTIYVASGEPVILHYDKGRAWITGRNGRLLSDGPFDFTRTYKGETKERIVAAATNLPESTTNVGSWVKNFDVIYAMDTNTQKCEDVYISVGVVCRGEITRETAESGSVLSGQWVVFHWYHDGSRNMEPLTWREALKIIGLYEKADAKVGIVVDSEYSNLADFNERKIPLCDEFYLPENRWMMYASADRVDEWCNKIIRQCDAIATEELLKLIQSPVITNCEEVKSGPVLHHTILNRELLSYIVGMAIKNQ